ncbi:SUKH superfamily protein [Kineococcus xinjiangensis]|uniref:SUKH superfamily protein n=1 Tax=Kineococcus xinjiangensis TaxID=512762 RepID=A0A2S6IC22_9ACTN|nr:SMI1/KNR4 family protein [Kineococcus xinjiangensis]PPK90180.1 SUKH superfamily protein [Kineococcus xinjiangensis]
MPELFDDGDYYTGPPLTDALITRAEEALGVKLPASYLAALRERNGGHLRRSCLPTTFPTTWSHDHFEVHGLLGLGGEWGIDSEFGSRYMIPEWDYPDVGVVICSTPSAGHDTVMLDYSDCGPKGEPAVVYVDEDRVPRRVADDFAEFLDRLRPCDEYDEDDEDDEGEGDGEP